MDNKVSVILLNTDKLMKEHDKLIFGNSLKYQNKEFEAYLDGITDAIKCFKNSMGSLGKL